MRTAILISGRGSNALALIDAARADDHPATIVGVLSDREDAEGLAEAGRRGVQTRAVTRVPGEHREQHERRIGGVLEEWDADLVCLAGYMRVLSPTFVRRWQGRMLNVHPSLLPAFPGLDTHERALARGVAVHGCTVHLVTDGVDEGPVVAQAIVPVRSDDTSNALAARVLAMEHRLYPLALADWIAGRTRLGEDGRIVRSGAATALLT